MSQFIGFGIAILWKKFILKFTYSEKATKFCEISTVDLTVITLDKSMVEISQKFVAFSEYMSLNTQYMRNPDIVYMLKMEYGWNFWLKVSFIICIYTIVC